MAASEKRSVGTLSRRSGALGYLVIAAFVALALVVNANWPLPPWVAGLYAAASVACFIVYAVDKSAAAAGRQRVPEKTLLLLGLIGGWPGAICAQQLLRHKTQKLEFRRLFWLTVVVNVLAFSVLATPALATVLSAVLPAAA